MVLLWFTLSNFLIHFVKEKSRKGTETAKKNKNHPHLGPGGYLGMESQWDEEEESGLTIKGHVIQCKRAKRFILARRKRNHLGQLILTPTSEPLADAIVRW